MDNEEELIDEPEENGGIIDNPVHTGQVPERLQEMSSPEAYNPNGNQESINIPEHNPAPVNNPRASQPHFQRGNRPNSNLGHPGNHQRPKLGAPTKDGQGNNPNQPNPNSTAPKSETNKGEKSKDKGARNLQNSLANRARNLRKSRKRKKEEKKKEEAGEENKEQSEDQPEKTSAAGMLDNDISIRKRLRIIKIVIYTAIIGFGALITFVFIMAVLGVDVSSMLPALNQSTYGTDQFTPTYEEGTKEYKAEIKYYEKLKEVSEKNVEEHGEEIKTTYIHAVLIYRYYLADLADEDNKIPIDYGEMEKMVDKIVELMIPEDENKTIDYEKNGEFWNNLKQSADFKEYYKNVLKEKPMDDLLTEIFDLAESLDEIEMTDETVITDETKVEVKKDDGKSGQKLSINDYLVDSIYADNTSISNSELNKAYTIAYSTNIAAKNKSLTIDASTATMNNNICSAKSGCSYKNGELVEGGGERSSKNTIYYDGKYYYKQPLTDSEVNKLNSDINSVFGKVLVKSDGTYPEVDPDKIIGFGDGTYETILKNTYGDYKIKSIGEGSYATDLDFGSKKVLTNVTMYDQSEYTSSFCGLKKENIASSGCGVTSMAIVMSTYEQSSTYTPLWTNDYARKNKQCGAGRGTDFAHFTSLATSLGYKKPTIYYKNKANGWKISKSSYQNVLKNLSDGNLIIINVAKGHFTGGGHYMVLGGIDPDNKKVYVYDPNNKNNKDKRNTGTGWYSFNSIIVPETKAFIIIKRKG